MIVAGILFLIVGFLGTIYSSITTVHDSTAKAMGATVWKSVVRVVSRVLLGIGFVCFMAGLAAL